jgi:hypothetical protein
MEPGNSMLADAKPKKIASDLAAELLRAAESAATISGDGGLSDEIVRRLLGAFPPAANNPGGAARDGRGSLAYWRDHGDVTAALMERIARAWGGDILLYRRVGLIHDADYLAYPHDAPGSGARHPVPLVRSMREAGVHPAICMAVLEHAPYAGFDREPSSRLSATLSVAEDLATIASLGRPFDGDAELSSRARDLLGTVGPCRKFRPGSRVRVETNVARFVNQPLALIEHGHTFRFAV